MSRKHYSLHQEKTTSMVKNATLLNVASARYGGDWHSVPHTHKHVELFYIVGGKGQFLIEDQLYPVGVNNLVMINSDVTHTEVSLDANPLEYIVLGIEGIDLVLNERSNGKFCILNFRGSSDIPSCLRNILREMEAKQDGYEDVCQAYMEILLIRLMRTSELSVPTTPKAYSANHQCASVRRYIDQHFKEPLSLDLLAEEAHMNKYYLSHTFKQEYGISPISYMISKRLEESKYLLRETDLSLSQIAHLLGFSSLSYFSQTFRRTENISPLEFRQSEKRPGNQSN